MFIWRSPSSLVGETDAYFVDCRVCEVNEFFIFFISIVQIHLLASFEWNPSDPTFFETVIDKRLLSGMIRWIFLHHIAKVVDIVPHIVALVNVINEGFILDIVKFLSI